MNNKTVTTPMKPMITPGFSMSLVLTQPTLYAMAFGGVLIGKAMPHDALNAITKPIDNALSPKAMSAVFAKDNAIGRIRFAVAVLDIKILRITVENANATTARLPPGI